MPKTSTVPPSRLLSTTCTGYCHNNDAMIVVLPELLGGNKQLILPLYLATLVSRMAVFLLLISKYVLELHYVLIEQSEKK